MPMMVCFCSCDAVIVFSFVRCWVVLVFRDRYLYSLPKARPQSLYFNTMTLQYHYEYLQLHYLLVNYSVKGEMLFVVSPFLLA